MYEYGKYYAILLTKIHKEIVIILLSFFFCLSSSAQVDSAAEWNNNATARPTNTVITYDDTAAVQTDSLLLEVSDSTSIDTSNAKNSHIPISDDAIDRKVSYSVPDSVIYDASQKKSWFYGKNVEIKSDDISLVAPYVIYDQDSSTLYAQQVPDSNLKSAKPTFAQGDENFTFEEMKYNFETQRALVTNARSQYDEGYILSGQTKRNNDETIYGYQNQYTTCSFEEPHFAIAAKKIKIIPNRVVVSGPARLEVAGVPTPLILPMALFPLSKGQKSGFILPTYDLSPTQGVGLRGMGYYFAINDNMDFKVSGNLYSYGSWAVGLETQYVKRYRFQSRVGLFFSNTVIGDNSSFNYSTTRSFNLRWNHSVEPSILHGYRFGANVDFSSPDFFRNNSYNNDKFLQNSTNSAISLDKRWNGTPFSFNLKLSQSQNNSTREYNFQLPTFTFNMDKIYPFQNKKTGSTKNWYQKISVNYIFNLQNQLSYIDTQLDVHNPNTYRLRNGMRHQINPNVSYKILKYFSFNPNFNYTEYWNTSSAMIHLDTITNTLDTAISNGFYASRYFSGGVSLNTTIYGLFPFKGKRLQAIRHMMVPTVSWNYTPNFREPQWNTYYQVRTDTSQKEAQYLSYFINSLNGNFAQPGNSNAISFSLYNTLEAKVKDLKNKGTSKKVNLLEQLNLGTSYNFIAESFKLAPLSLQASTRLLKQIGVQYSTGFTPYKFDSLGSNIDEYLWEGSRRYLRNTGMTLRVSGAINSKMFSKDPTKDKSQDSPYLYSDYLQHYVDFDIPWSVNVTFSGNLNKVFYDTLQNFVSEFNNSFIVSGDFNLTPLWKFVYSTGYDFKTKTINYTNLAVYRDLHCWEFNINVIPLGQHRSFNFTLNVKAAVLQDLRINKRQDFLDYF